MRLAFPLLCAAALADVEKPALIHSDAGCFVHALRAPPDASGYVERVVASGRAILHTARATGDMAVLVPATGVVAISTRRLSFRVTRILGTAADEERLYVLVWSGRAWDRPPAPDAPIEGGRYELRAFWLADGAPLEVPSLDTGLPKDAPPETLERGPLRLVQRGIECYGTRAAYKGRELQP
jgi:hypothetical protein